MTAADEFRQTFTCLGAAIADMVEERDRLRERLEIDPGGGDAIDVADSVISQLRSDLEQARNVRRDAIDNLAYRLWSVHPSELDEWEKTAPAMPSDYKGGIRAWFYACQIEQLVNGTAAP